LNANGHSLGVPPVGAAPAGFGASPVAIVRPVSLNLKGGDGAMRTAAMFPYTSMGYDGHFVASMNPAAIADWSAFVQSYLATGTPTIP
jgi:hypothetical protein